VLLVVVLLGLVRFVVLALRGKVTWRANTPVMDSHPRLFFAAVVLVIGGALIWLAIQAVG
jgi:hypothetical protein